MFVIGTSGPLFTRFSELGSRSGSTILLLFTFLHKQQLTLLEQHSVCFEIRSAIIRINTGGKSLIRKSSPGVFVLTFCPSVLFTAIRIGWSKYRR